MIIGLRFMLKTPVGLINGHIVSYGITYCKVHIASCLQLDKAGIRRLKSGHGKTQTADAENAAFRQVSRQRDDTSGCIPGGI